MKRIVEKTRKYFVYGVSFALLATLLWSCKYREKDEYGSNGLARVLSKEGKYGYINKEKKEVIPCIYDDAYALWDNDMIFVELKGKWGIIDTHGKELLPCKYDGISPIYGGYDELYKVELNGKYGFFDRKRENFIPCKYDEIIVFVGDKLIQVKIDGKIGFADKTGNEVITCKYDHVVSIANSRGGMQSAFSNGLAIVQMNGKSGLIDQTGEKVVDCKYDVISVFASGVFKTQLNGKNGLVDISGKELIPAKYDNISEVDNNRLLAVLNNESHLYDKQGNKLDLKSGKMKITNYNRNANTFSMVDAVTGKKLTYRTLVVNEMEVVKTNCVVEQGTNMVQFVLVESKLIGTHQEGSRTVSTYSGSKTVAYSIEGTLNYELKNGILTISR